LTRFGLVWSYRVPNRGNSKLELQKWLRNISKCRNSSANRLVGHFWTCSAHF
jgi:hypothetical protein